MKVAVLRARVATLNVALWSLLIAEHMLQAVCGDLHRGAMRLHKVASRNAGAYLDARATLRAELATRNGGDHG